MSIEQRARDALADQGFLSPGPLLVGLVMDALARVDEEAGGQRTHQFDYADLLEDTPELIDRTEGPLTEPGIAASYLLADVLNRATRFDEEAGS